jgi:Uma2 family endonuclease
MTALRKWDEPRPVKLTTDDFRRLAEAGAFINYAKTELIDGVIVAMNAQFSAHARAKSLLLRRLADAVEATMPGYEAWSEVSVSIPPDDMPEPDLVVTRFRGGREPVPTDTIALVVEVADTTAAYDLGRKAGVYAAAGIAEYWVIDIEARQAHQLWGPKDGAYAERRELPLGGRLEAATAPGVAVETKGL